MKQWTDEIFCITGTDKRWH